MEIMFSQLLPQSPKTQIPTHLKFSKVLHILNFFIRNVIESLDEFFIKKNYHEFDSHVGESLCQIRAYKINLISKSITEDQVYEAKKKIALLEKLLNKIKKDIISYEKTESIPKKYSESCILLYEFIKQNGFDFQINKIEFFLALSKVLTKYKTYYEDGNPCIDYILNKLQNASFTIAENYR
jgi:hypothetical protein